MSDYVYVRDICNHEDYPCCGCSNETYLMEASEARKLARKKVVKIVGKYRPECFW